MAIYNILIIAGDKLFCFALCDSATNSLHPSPLHAIYPAPNYTKANSELDIPVCRLLLVS